MGKVINLTKTSGALNFRIEQSEAVTKYLNEFKDIRIPSQVEENRLFWIIRHGDKAAADKARERLVKSHQRFVFAIAKRYSNDKDVVMDLVQEGNIGLLVAINTFNPDKGYKFLTYAVHYIRREMTNYLTSDANLVHKPNHQKTSRFIRKVNNDFLVNENRAPTEHELMDIITDEYDFKVSDVSDMYDIDVISIDGTVNTGNGSEMEVSDLSEYNNATASYNEYNEISDKEYNKERVKAYLSKLKDRERYIVSKFFGIDQEYETPLEDIADELGMTKERARQLVEESLKKLHKLMLAYNR